MTTSSQTFDPVLMSVLSSRIQTIAKQMTYTLEKSARSSVMASARDASHAICDANGDVIAIPLGLPVHTVGMGVTTRAVLEMWQGDLHPGDAILNNSPYHGNTHAADHTIVVPVFYEDELMFLCAVRGHQADCGNSIPTTYHAKARDVYEEGALIFPCVRVQREYRDIDDVIRMAKARIRVPDVWYGDYLAQIGAARVGEQELIKVVKKYGKETVKEFCRQWQEYGKRRMSEEIRKLPAGSCTNSSTLDPLPGFLDEGLEVKVTVTVEPEAGQIVVDFTDNVDCVACGLNLCEATVVAAGRTGIMNRLASGVPICEGALSRIAVKMREGSAVGKVVLPYSASVATNTVADRATLAVQCALNGLTRQGGMAEGGQIMPPSLSVISGYDSRYQHPFVTQLIMGITGGMGVDGHDGAVHYITSTGGAHNKNAVEIVEQKYPILVMQEEFVTDSPGAGQWDGGPSTRVDMRVRTDPVTFIWVGDGKVNPPRGAFGGQSGWPSRAAVFEAAAGEATATELPLVHGLELQPGQVLVSECSCGGGFGDPLDRDPESVRHRAREGWISVEKARNVYGVVLDTTPELYAVDVAATAALRARLRAERSAGQEGK